MFRGLLPYARDHINGLIYLLLHVIFLMFNGRVFHRFTINIREKICHLFSISPLPSESVEILTMARTNIYVLHKNGTISKIQLIKKHACFYTQNTYLNTPDNN